MCVCQFGELEVNTIGGNSLRRDGNGGNVHLSTFPESGAAWCGEGGRGDSANEMERNSTNRPTQQFQMGWGALSSSLGYSTVLQLLCSSTTPIPIGREAQAFSTSHSQSLYLNFIPKYSKNKINFKRRM
ncbi:hypothetical protein LSTR_LSTR017446 [Laodelphax striatellus]|uniref:Uncharacterized protein n=1 Tax=Laodelphax striatellus TaxID=195883 RepID=A0A482XIL0_LAOST|nr:hypothetical protein LSTR_LSTR017446 [Laodelphax striatellus]